MAQALIARGASLVARGVTGATLADLAAAAGLDLT
jgi:AcrR family transcriptional regulator